MALWPWSGCTRETWDRSTSQLGEIGNVTCQTAACSCCVVCWEPLLSPGWICWIRTLHVLASLFNTCTERHQEVRVFSKSNYTNSSLTNWCWYNNQYDNLYASYLYNSKYRHYCNLTRLNAVCLLIHHLTDYLYICYIIWYKIVFIHWINHV